MQDAYALQALVVIGVAVIGFSWLAARLRVARAVGAGRRGRPQRCHRGGRGGPPTRRFRALVSTPEWAQYPSTPALFDVVHSGTTPSGG